MAGKTPISGSPIQLPSLSGSATATADSKFDTGPLAVDTGGAGNRGFINNFAAAKASLKADDSINPPVSLPFSPTAIALGIAAVVIVGMLLRRAKV